MKLKMLVIKQSDYDLEKYSIARVVVSLISLLGIRDIVCKMMTGYTLEEIGRFCSLEK